MRYKSLLLLFLLLPSFNTTAVPKQILIVRHAEKQPQELKNYGELYQALTLKGYERAAALSQYFPGNFGLIDYVFATKPNQFYQSFRPMMTCAPTAYNVRNKQKAKDDEIFNLNFDIKETADLGKELLTNKKYDGKTIIVCWEHHMLKTLIDALNVDAAAFKEWPSDAFDVTFRITFDKGKTILQKLPQKLMYGDRASVNF